MNFNIKNKKILYDFLILPALTLCGIKYVFNIKNYLDIALFDESNYLYQGINLSIHNIPSSEYSPLYAVWYYFLHLFQSDEISLYYLNYMLVTVLLPFIFYVALRRFKYSALPALLISYLILIGHVNLHIWPRVVNFGACVMLLFFIIASLKPDRIFFITIILIGTLILSYIRPEYFLSFILLLPITIVFIIKDYNPKTKKYIWIFAGICIFSFIVITILGNPIYNQNRTIIAFSQHFAFNYNNWTKSNINPWTNTDYIFRQHFGDADTILKSFCTNPVMFSKHVIYNAIILIPKFSELFLKHGTLFLPLRMEKYEALILLTAIICILFIMRKRIRINSISQIEASIHTVIVILVLLIPSLISLLIIHPRDHYLVIPGLLLLLLIPAFLRIENPATIKTIYLYLLITLLLIITPIYPMMKKKVKENVETISFIKSLKIKNNVNMLEAEGGYFIYTGSNYYWVRHFDKNTYFEIVMNIMKVNMIVESEALNNDFKFKFGEKWENFKINYKEWGFKKFFVPKTTRHIYLSDELAEISGLSKQQKD